MSSGAALVLTLAGSADLAAEDEDTVLRIARMVPHAMQRCVDLDQQKRLEERLVQTQKTEAVGQLTAGIAHNFNNLLQTIIGGIGMVLDDVAPGERDLLSPALDSSRRAADMIRKLMVFSRQGEPRPCELVDLSIAIAHSVEMCRTSFDRRIAIAIESDSDLPLVLADRGQIDQVIVNLMLNARDAIGRGSPHMAGRPEIRIDAEVVGEAPGIGLFTDVRSWVRIRVSDTGVGMDEAIRRRVFEPFFTTKEVGAGTGLGLSTVYGIVREHGGWVDCASEPGEGSVFSVYLPTADRGVKDIMSETSTNSSPLRAPKSGETILVVDDEGYVRDLLVELFRMSGFDTLDAADGFAALEIFREAHARIDASLLDLSLPQMSGLEVLAKMREISPEARVIILSGHAPDSSAVAAADAVIHKPALPSEILAIVRQVLAT